MLTINGVQIPRDVEARGAAAIDEHARKHGAYAKREQDPAQREAVLAERAAAKKAAKEAGADAAPAGALAGAASGASTKETKAHSARAAGKARE